MKFFEQLRNPEPVIHALQYVKSNFFVSKIKSSKNLTLSCWDVSCSSWIFGEKMNPKYSFYSYSWSPGFFWRYLQEDFLLDVAQSASKLWIDLESDTGQSRRVNRKLISWFLCEIDKAEALASFNSYCWAFRRQPFRD